MIYFDDFKDTSNDTIINNITNSIETINSYITNITSADWTDSTIISNITSSISILSGEIKPYMLNITQTNTFSEPTSYLYNLSGIVNITDLNTSKQFLLGNINTVSGTTVSDTTHKTIQSLTINRANSIYSLQAKINYGVLSASGIYTNTFYAPYNLNLMADYYMDYNKISNTNAGLNAKVAISSPSFLYNTLYFLNRANITGDYLYGNSFQNINLVNLTGTSYVSNTYSLLNILDLKANTVNNNLFSTIYNVNLNANAFYSNTFTVISNGNIAAENFNNNFITCSNLDVNVDNLNYNTIKGAKHFLDCKQLKGNDISCFGAYMGLNFGASSNTILNGVGHHIIASYSENSFTITNGQILASDFNQNSISGTMLDLSAYSVKSNTFQNVLLGIKAYNFIDNTTNYPVLFNLTAYGNDKNLLKFGCGNINVYTMTGNTILGLTGNPYGNINASNCNLNNINFFGDLKVRNSFNSNTLSGGKIEAKLNNVNENSFCNIWDAEIKCQYGTSNTFIYHNMLSIRASNIKSNSFYGDTFLKGLGENIQGNTFSLLTQFSLTALSISSNTFNKLSDLNIHAYILKTRNDFNSITKLSIDYLSKNNGQSFNSISSLYMPDYLLSSVNTYDSVSKFFIENIDTLFDASGSYTGEQPIGKMYAQCVPFSLLGGGSSNVYNVTNNYTTVSSYSTVYNSYTTESYITNIYSNEYMKIWDFPDGPYQYNIMGGISNPIMPFESYLDILGAYNISALNLTGKFSKINLQGINMKSINITDTNNSPNINILANNVEDCTFSKIGNINIEASSISGITLTGGMMNEKAQIIQSIKGNGMNLNANNIQFEGNKFYSPNLLNINANSIQSNTFESGKAENINAIEIDNNSFKYGLLDAKVNAASSNTFNGVKAMDLKCQTMSENIINSGLVINNACSLLVSNSYNDCDNVNIAASVMAPNTFSNINKLHVEDVNRLDIGMSSTISFNSISKLFMNEYIPVSFCFTCICYKFFCR